MLRVDSQRAVALKFAAAVAAVAPLVATPVAAAISAWDVPLALIILWFALVVYPAIRYAPRVLRLELPFPGESPEPDDELFSDGDGDFSDMSLEEFEEWFGPVGPSAHPVGRDWRCKACGSPNESEFRLCWKCGNQYEDAAAQRAGHGSTPAPE